MLYRQSEDMRALPVQGASGDRAVYDPLTDPTHFIMRSLVTDLMKIGSLEWPQA